MKPVLYAEDSLASQALMRRFLKQTCEVTVAASVEAALELLEQNEYALVITDFLFPEGDAMDLITNVRRKKRATELPIIVVSSSMDRVLLSRVLRAGANEALGKPVDPVGIRELVEKMMTAPFVREQDHGVIGVVCFQWEAHHLYFQFCPELKLTVTGATKDEVAQNMLDELTRRLTEGADLGGTQGESMYTHIVSF